MSPNPRIPGVHDPDGGIPGVQVGTHRQVLLVLNMSISSIDNIFILYVICMYVFVVTCDRCSPSFGGNVAAVFAIVLRSTAHCCAVLAVLCSAHCGGVLRALFKTVS